MARKKSQKTAQLDGLENPLFFRPILGSVFGELSCLLGEGVDHRLETMAEGVKAGCARVDPVSGRALFDGSVGVESH